MQLAPVSRSASRSIVHSIPVSAPVGWNARDPISNMKPGYAIRLENWVRRSDGLHMRPGMETVCFGLNGAVTSLIPYSSPTHGDILFAATQTSVYNISSPAVEALTGLSSGLWTGELISNTGGVFLLICNGVDTPLVFNGLNWLPATIESGQANRTLDSTLLFTAVVHMRRAFMPEAGSLRLWYLKPEAFQGEAHCLDLAPLCRRGGYIVSVASMTMDGGRNTNDRLVVVTSNGEMIVYSGIDPTRSASWQLAAVFEVPRPIARKSLLRHGGDLAYLSIEGLLPVSSIMAKPDPEKPLVAFTDEIRTAYLQADRSEYASSVWDLAQSSQHRFTMINVPSSTGSVQFVKSADAGVVGGWSSFTGLNALCWASMGDDLFLGRSDGSVCRLTGASDNGAAIVAHSVEAYSQFKVSGRKKFSRIRPIFTASNRLRARMDLRINYQPISDDLIAPSTTFSRKKWKWSELSSWAQTPAPWLRDIRSIVDGWRSISGRGHSAALILSTSAIDPVVYEGAEIAFETGGQI